MVTEHCISSTDVGRAGRSAGASPITVGRRPRRGFTLVELSVATAVISLILIGIVTVMSNIAEARARSAWVDASEDALTVLMDRFTDIPYQELFLSRDNPTIPEPCPSEPQVSCIQVRGSTARVEWTVVPSTRTVPGGWAPAYIDVTARISLTASGLPSDLLVPDVTRRVVAGDQVSGTDRATLTVVADGVAAIDPLLLPSVYLVDFSGPGGAAVGVSPAATFDADGVAHIAVTGAGSVCTGDDPCRLAIGTTNEWWSTEEHTLTAPSVAGHTGRLVIGPGEQQEVALTFANRGIIAVDVLAQPDGGEPRPGAEPGSICLWAEFSDGLGVQTVPACNTGNGREVRFDTYAVPNPGNPSVDIDLPIPADATLTLLTDRRDGDCPNFASVAGYEPVGIDANGNWADADVCPSYTWGRPGLFAEPDGTQTEIADRWPVIGDATFGPPGTELRRYALTWLSTEARPATGYEGAQALFSDAVAANGRVAHLKLDESAGEITLNDEEPGPVQGGSPGDPGTGGQPCTGTDIFGNPTPSGCNPNYQPPTPGDPGTSRAEGRHPGTVSTIGGVTLGRSGSMDDDSTAAELTDDFAPALLIDARPVEGRDQIAMRTNVTVGLSVLLGDIGDPQELFIYGTPANGWLLRTDPADNRLVLTINGTDFRSDRDAYTPGIWQQIAVAHQRSSGQVRFYVDGIPAGTATGSATLPGIRDELGVGRLCPCLVDEIFILDNAIDDATAAELHAAARTAAEVGGPVWAKPRVVPSCEASSSCFAPDNPYSEYAACDPDNDRLCLSSNIAPIPVHEEFPYDHAFSPSATTEWAIAFADPEGDNGRVRIQASDLVAPTGSGGIEYFDETDEEWRSLSGSTVLQIDVNGQGTTVRFRHVGNGYTGAILMPLRTTDLDNNLTSDYVLGFHGSPVAYDIDLDVVGDDTTWDQRDGNRLRATVTGPGGQPLEGASVTFRLPGAFGGDTAVTTDTNGRAEIVIDTATVSAGDYTVSAQVADGAGGARQAPDTPNGEAPMVITVTQTPDTIVLLVNDGTGGNTIDQGEADDDLLTVEVRDRAGDLYDGVRARAGVEPRAGFDDNSLVFVAGAGDTGAGTCTTGDNGTGRCTIGIAAAQSAKADPNYVVTVRSGNAVASATVQVIGIVETITADDVAVVQGDTIDVAVVARNGDGDPAAGITITGTPTAGSDVIVNGPHTTNGGGVATFTVTAPTSADPGPTTVVFTTGGATPVNTTITVNVLQEIADIQLAAGPIDVAEGSVGAVTGRVFDGAGDVVEGATVQVSITDNNGNSLSAQDVRVPGTVRSGAGGRLLIPVTVPQGTPRGSYTVEVTAEDGASFPDDVVVNVVDPVPTVTVTAGKIVQGLASQPITVEAVDVDDLPVPAATIQFVRVVGLDGSATDVSGASFSPAGDGTYTSTLSNSITPVPAVGHLLILRVDGVETITAVGVTPTFDPTDTDTVVVDNAAVGQMSAGNVTVTVTDRTGSPLSGAQVTASVPGIAGVQVGARCNPGTGCEQAELLTGPDGTVSISIAAERVEAQTFTGAISVDVEIGGQTANRVVDLAVTPTLAGLSGPAGVTVGRGQSTTFVVSAVDAAGNPMPAAALTVEPPRATTGRVVADPSPLRISTDADGNAIIRIDVHDDAPTASIGDADGDSVDDYPYQIVIGSGPARATVGLAITP